MNTEDKLKTDTNELSILIMDTMPIVCFCWDEEHTLAGCNAEAQRLFELSSKQEVVERFAELLPVYQPDREASAEKMEQVLRDAANGTSNHYEFLFQKPNGDPILCDFFVIRIDHQGSFFLAGYARDLRAEKATLEELRGADEFAQIMLDAAPLPCCLFNNRHEPIFCNQEMVKHFVVADKREAMERVYSFGPKYQPDGRGSFDTFHKLIQKGFDEGYCRLEWMQCDSQKRPIPTEMTIVRDRYRGEYVVAVYTRDLRDHEEMLQEMQSRKIAEESNKQKSKFLASVSHEIRTPMNAILGITEIMMQDETLSPNLQEAVDMIYNSGDLLMGIINDLLDLSKIEAGKLELMLDKYELASLVNDTVHLNVMRINSRPIEFELKVDENIPAVLLGDELRIKQILNNLLNNAFKYTDRGTVKLVVHAEEVKTTDSHSGVVLVFHVTDSGCGMTQSQLDKLFDEYTRFPSEFHRLEGTGLGMSITKNLITLMNGEITVESELGKGTSVTVRLPQGRIGSDVLGRELAEGLRQFRINSQSQMRRAHIVREPMPYGSVLIVDDVETNLFVAKGLMSPYGLSIETVLSGYEAIEKVKAGHTYDVIFMDHMMPQMDGIEAVKAIRELGYTRPVVVLTANAVVGKSEMFLANGFDGFVSKPIDMRQLNALLNKMVRDKHSPEVVEAARRKMREANAQANERLPDVQLLASFQRDAHKALAVLKTLENNGGLTEQDDMQAYIIHIHGMKSALLNIGEPELSAAAKRLEQAFRQKDMNVISAEAPAFIRALRAAKERIRLEEEDILHNQEAAQEDTAFLREKLCVLQEACEAYNNEQAKAALTQIQQKPCSRSTLDALNDIAEYLLHSDFEEAANVAAKMIRMLNTA